MAAARAGAGRRSTSRSPRAARPSTSCAAPSARVRQGDAGADHPGGDPPGAVALARGAARRLAALRRRDRQPAPARPRRRAARPALTTDLRPTRRGDLRADRVTVRLARPAAASPARQGALDVPGAVRVLPAFPSLRHLPSRLARLRELDGRAAVRVRGQGTEFDSLREYVRGDDVRSVDWRASARSRSVVVRTWQPERDRRVVLVLDTGRTSAGRVDDVPRLDAAMDAALLLATLAAPRRRPGLLRGRRPRGALPAPGQPPARRGRRHPGRDGRAAAGAGRDRLAPAGRRGRRAQPPARAGRAADRARALGRRERPAAARRPRWSPATGWSWPRSATPRSTASPATATTPGRRTTPQPPSRPPASATRTAPLLGTLGVDVLDADADELPVRLADHYLALKARGLL